jgi:hypothetical protein
VRKRVRPSDAPVREARHRFVAVDDGRGEVIVALRVRPEHYDAVAQGDVVRVLVRRSTAHVVAVHVR